MTTYTNDDEGQEVAYWNAVHACEEIAATALAVWFGRAIRNCPAHALMPFLIVSGARREGRRVTVWDPELVCRREHLRMNVNAGLLTMGLDGTVTVARDGEDLAACLDVSSGVLHNG